MAIKKIGQQVSFPPSLFSCIWIRDTGWKKINMESGINILDPQHCYHHAYVGIKISVS